MAETFSPVRPSKRWGISFLVSASKICGVALANIVAAVADFKNEPRLVTASI
jgi:hypothetical protein